MSVSFRNLRRLSHHEAIVLKGKLWGRKRILQQQLEVVDAYIREVSPYASVPIPTTLRCDRCGTTYEQSHGCGISTSWSGDGPRSETWGVASGTSTCITQGAGRHESSSVGASPNSSRSVSSSHETFRLHAEHDDV